MTSLAPRCLATVATIALAAAGFASAQSVTEARIPLFSLAAAGGSLPRGWAPLTFKGVPPSRYSLVRDGDTVVVEAEANASASGLAVRLDIPLGDARVLRWRWKAERLPGATDTTQRATDDAVARVYVTFREPPGQGSATRRLQDWMSSTLYGEAPPHATLLYVWDNRSRVGASFPNPHTDRVRNIVVESGNARLSQWLAYERDLVADYRAAFGEAPLRVSGVAIMTDADNTGGRAAASYGDITLGAR